jgi:hypothetical protein
MLETLSAALIGEDRAFESLYRLHRPVVYAYALSAMHNVHDAADVTQTTFLNAYHAGGLDDYDDTDRNAAAAEHDDGLRRRLTAATPDAARAGRAGAEATEARPSATPKATRAKTTLSGERPTAAQDENLKWRGSRTGPAEVGEPQLAVFRNYVASGRGSTRPRRASGARRRTEGCGRTSRRLAAQRSAPTRQRALEQPWIMTGSSQRT